MDTFGIWGIFPPLLVIVLAFALRDVIASLTIGIFVGSLIVTRGNPFRAVLHFTDKIAENLSDGWNIRIVLFVLLLGGLVGLMIRTGATLAFADWAKRKIRSRKTSLALAWLCGIIVFIDDYFNSLVVGTIMRPVTDNFKVSRAKLSYILDSTAAPVCIIAPISSWVVTVMSIVKGSEGFSALNMSELTFFIRSIPYNIYALLTLFMILFTSLSGLEFGPMKKSEEAALAGQLYNPKFGEPSGEDDVDAEVLAKNNSGKMYDMLIPLALLIVTCVMMFPLTTYFLAIDGAEITTLGESVRSMSVSEAFNNTDASMALFYSIIITLIFTYVYYMARGLYNVTSASDALVKGIKTMVIASIILTLAWTIGGIIKLSPDEGGLGLSVYLSKVFVENNFPISILPILVFLVSALISFATGTSWGTFSIMIPISMPIVVGLAQNAGFSQGRLESVSLFCISAVLSGAVFGDHTSPISDSTILSSTGAACPHLEHVATQLPYAGLVALCACVGYLVGGIFGQSVAVSWITTLALFAVAFATLPKMKLKFLDR